MGLHIMVKSFSQLWTLKVIREFDLADLNDILLLEHECFPTSWQYPDARKYYDSILRNNQNINILLKTSQKTVGYALSVPLSTVWPELIEHDPSLKNSSDCYYLENIAVLSNWRGQGGATALIRAMIEEAQKNHVNRFSVHARISNHFSEKIKKMFASGVNENRKLNRWFFGGGEPYEFIEWIVP